MYNLVWTPYMYEEKHHSFVYNYVVYSCLKYLIVHFCLLPYPITHSFLKTFNIFYNVPPGDSIFLNYNLLVALFNS